MTSSSSDSFPTKIVETSTHSNIGPVPEQDPMINNRNVDYNDNINRDINKDYNRDVTNLSDTGESRGMISSVVEAARSAATRLRESFAGEPTATTTTYSTVGDRSNFHSDEQLKRTDDRDLTFSGTNDKTTTEKIKDTAYDAKEKLKDTSRDIKDKVKDVTYQIKDKTKDASRDIKDTSKDTHYEIKDKAKDTAYDVKDKVKDTTHDIKDKAKDTAYDIKDKAKDASRDIKQNRSNETNTAYTPDTHKDSLSADSDIAADSNKQRLRDIKEKIGDALQTPVEMIQTMLAASKDRMYDSTNQDTAGTTTTTVTTQPVSVTPGTSDMFSDTYQPAASVQYQTGPSTTEKAKSTLASTTAKVADKAENWIADNKHKLNEHADKAQDLAAETKHKASQEAQKEPASDTRYYSGVHGQTY